MLTPEQNDAIFGSSIRVFRLIHLERLSALEKMAGGVAHDFNNALIPILGYAELLNKRVTMEDLRSAIAALFEDSKVPQRWD